ncbi:ABC-three component system middle component 1 [Pantoea ananatis]|uniref:ABC-three component system middle component 1 n=1 Tax=Pantoea ananas TaxID=553 RepID=UPI0032ECCDBB
MISITYENLSFEREKDAKYVILKYGLILFKDDDDIIICYGSTSENIKDKWVNILSEIAFNFQANLLDEIQSKNLLLVFCAKDSVSVDLKKEIQSDTYCCRKVVRSNVSDIKEDIKSLILYNVKTIMTPDSKSLIDIIKEKHHVVYEMIRSENEIK